MRMRRGVCVSRGIVREFVLVVVTRARAGVRRARSVEDTRWRMRARAPRQEAGSSGAGGGEQEVGAYAYAADRKIGGQRRTATQCMHTRASKPTHVCAFFAFFAFFPSTKPSRPCSCACSVPSPPPPPPAAPAPAIGRLPPATAGASGFDFFAADPSGDGVVLPLPWRSPSPPLPSVRPLPRWELVDPPLDVG